MLIEPFLLCVYLLGAILAAVVVFDASNMPGGGWVAVAAIALMWPIIIVMMVVGGLFLAFDSITGLSRRRDD